jgi:hypothetical protein
MAGCRDLPILLLKGQLSLPIAGLARSKVDVGGERLQLWQL